MATLQTISLVFLVLFPLFEAACYSHLYWNRKDILIRKRNKAAIYVASLAGWLAYFNLVISVTGGVPCGVFYVVSLLVAPISVGPQIIRALTLRGTIKYSQLVTEEEISSRAQRKRGADQLATIQSGRSDEGGESSPHLMTKLMEANLVMEKTRRAVKMTKWVILVVPTLLLVLGLALTSDQSQLRATDFDQCQPEPTYFQYASPAFGVVTTALALFVTILVKKIDDEIGLRREIQRNAVLLGFTYIVIIVVRFRGHYDWQPLLQTIQQMMLSFSMSIIPFIPESSLNGMASWAKKQGNRINPATKSAVPGYAQSLPKGRNSTHISTRTSIQLVLGRRNSMSNMQNDQRNREMTVSWDAGLCILLSTEDGINLFSQHCAREFRCFEYDHSSENVRFWCAVNHYKAKFDEEKCIPPSTEVDDERQTSNDESVDMSVLAKNIYNQFIDHPSNTQVNLSSKQRTDIKKAIGSGQVNRGTFDAAQREIFAVMSRDSYPRFLASKKNRQQM
ncbi:hypothetical protein ACHAXR_009638 [Thalassiosira sp. AJA248-18]